MKTLIDRAISDLSRTRDFGMEAETLGAHGDKYMYERMLKKARAAYARVVGVAEEAKVDVSKLNECRDDGVKSPSYISDMEDIYLACKAISAVAKVYIIHAESRRGEFFGDYSNQENMK